MSKQSRLKIMMAAFGVVAVSIGISWWQRDARQAAPITSVADLKQIGLSFRWERNDLARFTAEVERLTLPTDHVEP